MTETDLTIIIVAYKSEETIEECLKSINKKVKIIVIENSQNQKFKKEIEKNFSNVQCIVAHKNLGYSRGNNLALKEVKTKYSLILNPDTVLEENTLNNFFKFLKKKLDFAILGPLDSNQALINTTNSNLVEVEMIKGHAMFLNMEKIKRIGFFDENFFLYFEEIDLCRRVKKNNEKIYIDSDIKIKHYGGQSVNKEYSFEIELTRNWHWMWSTFYYHKKNNNFLIAFIIILPKLIRALFRILFYSITLNKKLRLIYFYRLSGILNSLIGKSSWYRPNIV
jgi:N-acetylglucosaminyl-diphospho-decaprenol L-rhamnosyltransferase